MHFPVAAARLASLANLANGLQKENPLRGLRAESSKIDTNYRGLSGMQKITNEYRDRNWKTIYSAF
jgi:hypothetical protein